MNWLREIAAPLIFFAVTVSVSITEIPLAWGKEYRLKLVPSPHLNEVVSDIKWDEGQETRQPVLQIRKNNEPEKKQSPQYVRLRGSFIKSNRTLIYEYHPVTVGSDGKFTIEVGVNSERQEFIITEIDETGSVLIQKSELLFPEFSHFEESLKVRPLKKKWSVTPGVGFTLSTYQQTGLTSITETLLTLKVSGDYAFVGPWNLGVSAYYTVLPLTGLSHKSL
jgi:hypothetical protein